MNKNIFLYTFLLFTFYVFSQENKQIKIVDDYYKKAVDFERSNIDSSFFYIKKSYDLFKVSDTLNEHFSDVLNQYGRLYFYKQDFGKAYAYFNRCYMLSLKLKNEPSAFKVKVNMAVCQDKLNNQEQALKDFLEVANYFEEYDASSTTLGMVYFNTANIYLKIEKFEIADTFYVKSLPFFEDKKALYVQLQSNRIGNFNNYNLEEAKRLGEHLISTINFNEIPVYIKASLFNNMAQTMMRSGDYEKALIYTTRALQLKKTTGISNDIAIEYNNVADVYINAKKYDLAIQFLDSAFQKVNTNRQKLQIIKNFQKAYKGKNNHQKALEYATLYIVLKDSLNEVLTQKEIVELGLKYEAQAKDKFITKLENISEIYKIALILFVLLGLFIALKFYKKNAQIKKELKQQQEELNTFRENDLKEERLNVSHIHLKSNAILNGSEILYAKSDGHYAEIFMEGREKPEIERTSLTSLLELLPKQDFVRIHKSYIVNLHKIKIINSTQVMLENGEWIKLSRTYKQDLKDLIHKN